ncbi:MAG: thioredoxin [Alphaproteobacteria bacterium]|nr:thioredoxin [Alphaproteobacteria bacterium]
MNVITDEQFEAEIKNSDKPVLIDFFAEWCSPCRQLLPLLDEAATARASALKVVKMDIDQSPETPAKFNVRGIPTLILFKNGEAVATHSGGMTKSKLNDWLDKSLG